MSNYFKYNKNDLESLKKKDKKLSEIIDLIGVIKRPTEPNIFKSLVSSLISQLISTKAALTISNRFWENIGETPEEILKASVEDIKSCGISLKKAENILEIAKGTLDGRLNIDNYPSMSNDEIIEELIQFRGIGQWTCEMLLLFSLNRMDILSYNDLIIRQSLCRIYDIEKLTKKDFKYYQNLFSPYGSIASLYLWEYKNF